jgi:hypothetical protein
MKLFFSLIPRIHIILFIAVYRSTNQSFLQPLSHTAVAMPTTPWIDAATDATKHTKKKESPRK